MGEPPEAPDSYTKPVALSRSPLSRVGWSLSLVVFSFLIYTPGIRQSMFVSPASTISGFATFATANRFLYLGVIISLFLILSTNLVLHEMTHKVASNMVGYHSEVKLKPILHRREPYNYIPDEWVDRGEYQLISIAPLFVINLFAASLIIIDISPSVAMLGKSFLVANTATSADDIRTFFRGLTDDVSTRYHHTIESHSLVVYKSVEESRSVPG